MQARTFDAAGGTKEDPPVAVRMVGVTKRFGAVVACDRADFSLERGRIHGLLGENGAGKSTLMKILIGLVTPDAGEIYVHGERQEILDPVAAATLGLGMVHQHFSLVNALSVWENVALGEPGRLDPRAVRARVGEISDHFGLDIDPYATVGDLPAALQQRVEIIKCLRRDPSVLIFDEPTSVLTPEESFQLFDSLRRVVTDEGRAVALVSHKLDEVLQTTDNATIMRQGAVVERLVTAETNAAELARAMVGRPVALRSDGALQAAPRSGERPIEHDEPVLTVESATVRVGEQHELDCLDLEVFAGEIVGVAGVEGNGQSALVDVLASLTRLHSGAVRVNGRAVPTGKSGAMAAAGIAVIPADRHDSGIVLQMTVAENLLLVHPEQVSAGGLLDPSMMSEYAQQLIDEYEIQCEGPDSRMWSLSGGNQQRVVLARELSSRPLVLVAAQPTRGLDVGAIEYTTGQIRRAASDGVGVLLVSSELEEILDLSDRIIVLSEGRTAGAMARDDVDMERLGLLMGGHQA